MRNLRWQGGGLAAERVAVMGILNVTPDSFFDGGRYGSVDQALARAKQILEEGADVLDVGGESTRPGSVGVSLDEELNRVLPIVRALRTGSAPYPLPISVDTSRAEVADAALAAGAEVINDVTGGTREPEILDVVGQRGAGLVLMHMRGSPETMQDNVEYKDLVASVLTQLEHCCAAASSAGVPLEYQAVDPGIGFGKSAQGCLELLARLGELQVLGRPILLGASRKSFLGAGFGHEGEQRLVGSLVAATQGVLAGASIVRVHDVQATRLAVDVAAGIRDACSR
ncbi:MAG: dihydropteroate synthase [Rickettsiales bacterium]|nr:dihydropteroate synthase [Rickettsiales bacterium]|tara:strand:- start:323 stop:1174 length:852 start_codon:yes stop_codon:yes gene_type:complete